jgi:hypothetical protein
MESNIQTILFAFILCVFLISLSFNNKFKNAYIFIAIFYILFINVNSSTIENYKKEEKIEFVSTTPPSTGGIEINFYLGTGYSDDSIFYILREEVEKNIFKDFIVKDTLIKINSNLENHGYYIETKECTNYTYTIDLFFIIKNPVGEEEICNPISQKVIHVPEGYVVRNMSI